MRTHTHAHTHAMPAATEPTEAPAPDALLKEFKAAAHPKPNSRTKATDRSEIAMNNASYQLEKATNLLWAKASDAPLFRKKKTQKVGPDGRAIPFAVNKDGTVRSSVANRALSAHTIRAFCSGAAGVVAARMQQDAATLRLKTDGESIRYPALPSVSEGAANIFANAIIAYAHEIFGNAAQVKDTLGKHGKLTARSVAVGAAIANRKLAAATGFVPAATISPIKKTKKRMRVRKAAVEQAPATA